MFHVPESARRNFPNLPETSIADGNNGLFVLQSPSFNKEKLICVASDGHDWEHVSCHARSKFGKQRLPTYGEMCYIKDMFWDAEDMVIEIHARKSQHINMHEFVLHLWKPIGIELPEPPSILMGF